MRRDREERENATAAQLMDFGRAGGYLSLSVVVVVESASPGVGMSRTQSRVRDSGLEVQLWVGAAWAGLSGVTGSGSGLSGRRQLDNRIRHTGRICFAKPGPCSNCLLVFCLLAVLCIL